jgi:hypothetical protein
MAIIDPHSGIQIEYQTIINVYNMQFGTTLTIQDVITYLQTCAGKTVSYSEICGNFNKINQIISNKIQG